MTSQAEPSQNPIVHIVDDDEAVRDSLSLLMYSVGIDTATYASATEFLERFDPMRPGCLIADVRMPGMSGLELQRQLRSRNIALPIIILTGHGDVPMAVTALKAGAHDFLEKPYREQQLLDTVQQALAEGDRVKRDQARAAQVQERYGQLTGREREVLPLMIAGQSNKAIGEQLGISPRTVEIHRAKVMSKLGARTLSELVVIAQVTGTGPGL